MPFGPEDRNRIARDAGDGQLRHRDHAAIPAEDHQRQRDHAENESLRPELEHDERGGDDGEAGPAQPPALRLDGVNSTGTISLAAGGRGGSANLVRALPMIPCGRSASVTTMMTNVSTTP